MKKVKILKPINYIIFVIASSNIFNVIMDFVERRIIKNKYILENTYYSENDERLIDNIDCLSDEKSKIVYSNIVNYRRTHDRKYMRGIVDKEQYFDKDIVRFGNNEIIVDCGAYTGDTIKKIKKKISNDSWKVIALEPDDYNFQQLEKFKKSNQFWDNKINIYNVGSWNEKTTLYFQDSMGDSSRISETGTSSINVDSIDNIVQNENVTFIKMDVEGAELNSLKGAYSTIIKNHPTLAISIYHSEEDMVEIIEYLRNNFPFYRLYVRHYTWLFTDTVCYAVADDHV